MVFMTEHKFTVAVLIGGDSSRMGVDKANFEIDGISMGNSVIAAARAAQADEVLVIGSTQAKSKALDAMWKKDIYPGDGPLGGIISALKAAQNDSVVVLSCDMPFVTSEVISSLVRGLTDAQAAVGRTDRMNWLCAAWSKEECLSTLQSVWKRNERSVHRAAVLLDVVEIPVPAVAVRNINSMSDLVSQEDATNI